MTTTPYDIIGKEALYDMIDYFYTLVEKDERLNHLFPGDFAETSRKQKQFLTQFLGGPNIYTEEHGHPMLRKRHMAFTITDGSLSYVGSPRTHYRPRAAFPQGVGDYLFERLRLTANHMVNS